MDNDSQAALRLLQTVANSQAQFLQWGLEASNLPEVRTVKRLLDCSELFYFHEFIEDTIPEKSLILSFDLEVELETGIRLTWQIQAIALEKKRWRVSPKVSLYDIDEGGASVLHSFPEREALTLDELIAAWSEAVFELLDHAQSFDFESFTPGS